MSTEITTSESQAKQKAKSAKKTKAAKPAKAGKSTKSANVKPSTKAKGDTKKAIVLGLLRRKEGATITELAKAIDWQNHSIRGFISGTITKKMGLTVESTKNEGGERPYRIT